MRPVLKIVSFILFVAVFVHLSCKKEYSCEGCADKNKPPIAIAGPDQVITLPTDSIFLDGTASKDPDGKISEWLWTKISGPASFTITKPTDSTTKIKALVTATYQFELKVTDNGGLSANDTMRVIVNASVPTNYPPIANAGADQTITLPTNAINLDGSASTDPENNITGYIWTKISGPTSFNILNANTVQTQVNNLVPDTYQFELKVTDASGLFSKDTMQVIVKSEPLPFPTTCDPGIRSLVNAQLVPVGILSQARAYMAVSSVASKILFAGGESAAGIDSRVDIYDILSNTGTTAELSQARNSMGAVTYGNKIFFAGGKTSTSLTSRIDIYDLTTSSWSTHELSIPRTPSAATAADKIVFAGGVDAFSLNEYGIAGVDIYNASTNTWSTSAQGGGRQIGATTSYGNKIYFAGGYENVGLYNEIDIYDAVSNSWSSSSLSQYKAAIAGIAVDNKIYWAGGDVYNFPGGGQTVEIRDINTQTTSFACLFQPNAGDNYGANSAFDAVIKNNKIVFFTGQGAVKNKFDIYDITTNTWSIGVLAQNIEGAAIISVNNTIYVAGGFVNGVLSKQVWKLEF